MPAPYEQYTSRWNDNAKPVVRWTLLIMAVQNFVCWNSHENASSSSEQMLSCWSYFCSISDTSISLSSVDSLFTSARELSKVSTKFLSPPFCFSSVCRCLMYCMAVRRVSTLLILFSLFFIGKCCFNLLYPSFTQRTLSLSRSFLFRMKVVSIIPNPNCPGTGIIHKGENGSLLRMFSSVRWSDNETFRKLFVVCGTVVCGSSSRGIPRSSHVGEERPDDVTNSKERVFKSGNMSLFWNKENLVHVSLTIFSFRKYVMPTLVLRLTELFPGLGPEYPLHVILFHTCISCVWHNQCFQT